MAQCQYEAKTLYKYNKCDQMLGYFGYSSMLFPSPSSMLITRMQCNKQKLCHRWCTRKSLLSSSKNKVSTIRLLAAGTSIKKLDSLINVNGKRISFKNYEMYKQRDWGTGPRELIPDMCCFRILWNVWKNQFVTRRGPAYGIKDISA